MDYVGHVDEVTRFYVVGWVADRDDWSLSLKVDVLVNGSLQGGCVADKLRPSLGDLHPDATGCYAFRFYFAAPLSMFDRHDVTVQVSGTTYCLMRQGRSIPAIVDAAPSASQRPLGPILLSTMGRTGSTAVMSILGQHPNVVVAGDRPYEVELGCYYAYALRTLLAAGDHERSLRTDDITAVANRFQIGFNPYFAPAFASVFKNPATLDRFMSGRLPVRLAGAFRDIILDYYEDVATDQGVVRPIYFAEKSLPERDARLGIRFMFPNVREVVLVRDLRDVVCSAGSSNGVAFDRLVMATTSAARQILNIDFNGSPNTFLVRYEDLILDEPATTAKLFQFLGLTSVAPDTRSMTDLFAAHATSATPAASIGRWKRDLTPEQQAKCKGFETFLERFNYTA